MRSVPAAIFIATGKLSFVEEGMNLLFILSLLILVRAPAHFIFQYFESLTIAKCRH
jgi:hypothetical protein